MSSATAWADDLDFEEYEIKKVELDRNDGENGTWKVKMEYDFEVEWPRGAGRPQPKVGDVCRVFGDITSGWGARGAVIGTRAGFYRSNEEQAAWVSECKQEDHDVAKRAFDEVKDAVYFREDSLPEELQARIEAAREAAEDKEDFEVYVLADQLVRYEHAHMLALVFNETPSLETFSMMKSQRQMADSWRWMCEAQIESLENRLAKDIPEDEEKQLQEERDYLKRYQEQRFFTGHADEELTRVFEIANELITADRLH